MISLDYMKFKNFMEFFDRRKKLRVYYVLLNYDEKCEYKKFIYNLSYKNYVKDRIWEYFNESKASPYYVFDYELIKYANLYKKNKNNIEL